MRKPSDIQTEHQNVISQAGYVMVQVRNLYNAAELLKKLADDLMGQATLLQNELIQSEQHTKEMSGLS